MKGGKEEEEEEEVEGYHPMYPAYHQCNPLMLPNTILPCTGQYVSMTADVVLNHSPYFI